MSLLELCNSLGQAKLTDSLEQQQCKLDFCTHDQIVCLEFMVRVLKNKVFSFYFVLIRLSQLLKNKVNRSPKITCALKERSELKALLDSAEGFSNKLTSVSIQR